MALGNLKPPARSKRAPRREGRGPGSGLGKTAGRGHKGQRARAGSTRKPGFEGGQMPLQRRLPRRGFTNIFKKRYAILNVGDLSRFEGGTEVTPELLRERGLVRKVWDGVKILGEGEISHPLTVEAHKFSSAAAAKIEAAGGRVKVIAS